MAPVFFKLKEQSSFEVVSVYSGQHENLIHNAFEAFNWEPDVSLKPKLAGSNVSKLVVELQTQINEIVESIRPELILVHGDTATTLAAALVASMNKIKLGHVEAGLRSGSKLEPWPEEIIRRLTDSMSDYHFCPTKNDANNLTLEGIDPSNIYVTGNTVVDAINIIDEKHRLEGLDAKIQNKFEFIDNRKKLILLTGHRRENFGENFLNLCTAIEKILLQFDCQIVFPVHPNGQLEKALRTNIKRSRLLHLIEPLGYGDFVFLMKRSDLIITDSGGIQEEALSIQKHVIVTRNVTERMEGLSTGYIHLTGCDPAKIIETTRMIFETEQKYSFAPNPFGDGDAAEKITKCLLDISRMQET